MSPNEAILFPGFLSGRLRVKGAEIPYLRAGAGPPLLLLHGHPQTKAIWHKMAARLALRFTVVLTDLRGYGNASRPVDAPNHVNMCKREMALDQFELMRTLGFASFGLIGHDRGARVAHRLAIDHPDAVQKLMLLDICPTLAMYEQTSMEFARAYWHWFLQIQPAPLPETLINADPEFYLSKLMGMRSAGLAPFVPAAWAEYVQAARDPACVHSICEDYRAAAGIDLEHDRADRAANRRIDCPLTVLWGKRGVIERCFEPLLEWRRVASDVRGHSLDCGHYLPEEAPEVVATAIEEFFA
jgi:haloacetate dehalogenase